MQPNRTAAPVVTLTRAERDTLRERIPPLAASADPLADLDRRDASQALKGRRRHEACFALLDDLGWHAADPRAEYPVRSVGRAQLEQLLEEARADAAQTVADDDRVIALRAGDASWGSMTEIAESLAEARDLRDRDLAALRTIEAILARLAEQPAPAGEDPGPLCENCRAPAAYWHDYPHGRDAVCERCARRAADQDAGAAMAAGHLLGAAVDQLAAAGLAGSEIRAALESALREPGLHDHAHAWAGAGGLERDPRWIPITGQEA